MARQALANSGPPTCSSSQLCGQPLRRLVLEQGRQRAQATQTLPWERSSRFLPQSIFRRVRRSNEVPEVHRACRLGMGDVQLRPIDLRCTRKEEDSADFVTLRAHARSPLWPRRDRSHRGRALCPMLTVRGALWVVADKRRRNSLRREKAVGLLANWSHKNLHQVLMNARGVRPQGTQLLTL